MPITTKHHAQSNSNPGLKSDYMARTLTLALPCSLLTLLFFSITLPAHLLSESLLTILICSPCSPHLVSSAIVLSRCLPEHHFRKSWLLWFVVSGSLRRLAHRKLAQGQSRVSEQTCTEKTGENCANLHICTHSAHLAGGCFTVVKKAFRKMTNQPITVKEVFKGLWDKEVLEGTFFNEYELAHSRVSVQTCAETCTL